MTRIMLGISVVMVVVLAAAYACVYEVFGTRHTETLLTEATSPDGAWKAVEYEEFYDGAFPFLTEITAEVRLVSTRSPARTAVILGVSAHGADEDPDIAWTAPGTLQVNVRGSVYLKILTCEFEGVHIDIRLPADDAANRAAYYAQTGDPDPDPGGVRARRCPAAAAD